jgi:hypothetical protein
MILCVQEIVEEKEESSSPAAVPHHRSAATAVVAEPAQNPMGFFPGRVSRTVSPVWL